jgi:kumamolisin
MDIEVVAGVCPNATIPVYFGHFTERGWVNILDKAIHDTTNSPSVLSISYGLAEGLDVWTEAAMNAINDSFKEAALLGITICISSGDDGSDAQARDGYAHVSFPSSSPYVLAVGGTNLTKVDNKINEVVWKDGDGLRRDNGGSTGGGVSSMFDRPSWQSKIKINPIDPGAIAGRVVPDVAAHAQTDGNTTGYFIVVDGQSARNGGTSAAAPLWASLIGRINALLPADKRTGYLTPMLYQAASGTTDTLGTVGCRDITVGDNNSASIGGFAAAKGYDAVSGWGAPVGKNLFNALKKLL